MNMISEAVLTSHESVLHNHAIYEADIGRRRSGRQSTTLLAVQGRPGTSIQLEIIRNLEQRSGVTSAKFVSKKASMLLVNYYPDQELVLDIIRKIKDTGVTVRRIC